MYKRIAKSQTCLAILFLFSVPFAGTFSWVLIESACYYFDFDFVLSAKQLHGIETEVMTEVDNRIV